MLDEKGEFTNIIQWIYGIGVSGLGTWWVYTLDGKIPFLVAAILGFTAMAISLPFIGIPLEIACSNLRDYLRRRKKMIKVSYPSQMILMKGGLSETDNLRK